MLGQSGWGGGLSDDADKGREVEAAGRAEGEWLKKVRHAMRAGVFPS